MQDVGYGMRDALLPEMGAAGAYSPTSPEDTSGALSSTLAV